MQDATPPGPALLPRWLIWFEDHVLLNLAALCMAGSMGVMFIEASSRSLGYGSFWWAEEAVRFLVVWSVLLALGLATRRGHYIRMDLLLGRLPRFGRMAAAWVNCLAGLAFSLLLVVAGWKGVEQLDRVGMMTESNLDLPLSWVRVILPVGAGLYALYFAAVAVSLARGHEPEQPVSEA